MGLGYHGLFSVRSVNTGARTMVGFRIMLVVACVAFSVTQTFADSEQDQLEKTVETPIQMLIPGFSQQQKR